MLRGPRIEHRLGLQGYESVRRRLFSGPLGRSGSVLAGLGMATARVGSRIAEAEQIDKEIAFCAAHCTERSAGKIARPHSPHSVADRCRFGVTNPLWRCLAVDDEL